ncbi:TPA: acyl-CoA dehydrogenase [Burkholderia multivorans]|uniref:acyl-CoA dehydrogenase family protein n=1 Tax=Burkholderia multivorans TaxID=87883 RepID=UPI00201A21E8|nr:acyl-CoA dehydrogenase [Burkholderia multivorans]MCO1459907.1 acyl-CoA dehydrogenase [Burkholderia multivorans]UQO21318.1 acyl-CoA dehydrogenase [Burkholderia multivorans]HEM7842897.1 acyl-CoA dehydrogenase [Burkholderia multivorans]HEM7908282.1 acyl-CoA dehydrogenase [Burkholderia multivorans]HEM8539407.1 acyl-CoA dehydrogenase [Burkholderia multivorans]
MNASLTSDQQKISNLAGALAREAFAPRAAALDAAAALPLENLADLQAAGLLTLTIGKDLGGHGSGIGGEDPLLYLLVLEQISRVCLPTSHCLQVHCHAAHFIDQLGTNAQRHDILGDIITHGALMTTLSSEPGRTARGSRNESVAQPTDTGWTLSGVKNYATLAGASTWLLVLADARVTGTGTYSPVAIADGERLALVTKADAPGVSFVDQSWNAPGMRPAVSPTVRFDQCQIGWNRVIGESNAHLSGNWSVKADLGFAAQYVGAAQGLLDSAIQAVRHRSTTTDQHVQRHVGRLHFAVDSARALYREAARLWTLDDKQEAGLASIGAKHLAIETANQVLDITARIVGPTAFSSGTTLERQFRDLRFLTMREHPDQAATTVGKTLLEATTGAIHAT